MMVLVAAGARGLRAQGEPILTFLTIPIEAQSVGIGESGTALNGSLSLLHLNPAQINFVEDWDIFYNRMALGTFSRPEAGYFFGGAGVTLNEKWKAGLFLRRFTVGEAVLIGGDDPERTITEYDMAIGLSIGRNATKRLSWGANLSYLRSVIREASVNSFAVDIGLLWRDILPKLGYRSSRPERPTMKDLLLRDDITGLNIGVALLNAGPSIQYSEQFADQPIPQRLRLGLAWQLLSFPHSHLRLTGEMEKPLHDENSNFLTALFSRWSDPLFEDMHYHAGFQVRIFYLVTIRGGLSHDALFDETRKTFGFGLDFKFLSLNYGGWFNGDDRSNLYNDRNVISIRVGEL